MKTERVFFRKVAMVTEPYRLDFLYAHPAALAKKPYF